MTLQNLKTIIDECGIGAAHIAKSIGMKRGTFNNKLKGNNGSRFTDAELDSIKNALMNIAAKIVKESN